jgi:hypothetical protein
VIEMATNRRFPFIVSDQVEDHEGDVVLQDGLDWSEFDRHPVACLGHQNRQVPVGRWANRRRSKDGRQTVMDLIPDDGTPEGRAVGDLVEKGFLGGASISITIKPGGRRTRTADRPFQRPPEHVSAARVREISITDTPTCPTCRRLKGAGPPPCRCGACRAADQRQLADVQHSLEARAAAADRRILDRRALRRQAGLADDGMLTHAEEKRLDALGHLLLNNNAMQQALLALVRRVLPL